eukprot:3050066-Amphidinium_carterae.1
MAVSREVKYTHPRPSRNSSCSAAVPSARSKESVLISLLASEASALDALSPSSASVSAARFLVVPTSIGTSPSGGQSTPAPEADSG